MSTLFYRNLRLLLLTILLIFVWGLSSYLTLPRLEDPELVSRNAVVKTFLPGANAERVEALITEKIEEELGDIEEIETYESTSRPGSSIIEIELSDGVSANQVDLIWSRIRDRIARATAELPPRATEPELEEIEVKAYAAIAALTWEREDAPNWSILRRKAQALEEAFMALTGTESTEIFGAPDEEILVEIDGSELATRGLTPQDLSQQIFRSDAKEAAGQLRSVDSDLLIEVAGELELERVRQIPVRFGNDAQVVFLGDIAQVSKGVTEPLAEMAIVGGRTAVVVGVFVESERRLDQWAEAARATLEEFQEQLARGLELQLIFDQSRYVNARLNDLMLNLLLGAALVIGVTLLMMGWQSAVAVGAALPLSLLMVFGCMGLLNIPLHQMSVTGLIVALGILIDTAIVVVDEMQHRLRQEEPEAAITQSVRYLAVPLLSSTLTTILAFMPIALLSGSVGEFVGTIGLNVILAVAASLGLALTIIPALAAWMHQRANPKVRQPVTFPALSRLYRRTLAFAFARPVMGIGLALVLPAAGFMVAPTMEQQFFPTADRDQLQIELELPATASLAQTQILAQQMRDRLMSYPKVTNVHWFIGENAPRFYYNLTGGRENEAYFAQALVQLDSLADPALVQALQAELNTDLAAQAVVRQLEQGPPFDAPVEVRIYGSDLKQLRTLGETARALLTEVPSVTHTRASIGEIVPQIQLQLDEEQARLTGLDRRSIARQLNTTLEGTLGGSVLESTEELPVRVRLSNRERSSLEQITSINLLPSTSDSRELIPLSALGDVDLVPELAKITSRNGQRVNTVQGFIQAGTIPANVLSQFQQNLAGFELPSGYRLEFGGEAEERADAVGKLVATIGVLAVLMVATLVLSLQSFKLAGLIGVVAVASFGLGLLAVWLFGYPFGFNPIIGTVGLVGVAINDSIVVLAALVAHPAARLGDRRAVRQVVLHSTRHVLTTTLTTIVGFIPLLLGGGGFWPPLAVAIAGGVGGATLLALYFIPSAYLLLMRRR